MLKLGILSIQKKKINFKLNKDGTLNKSRLAPDWNNTLKLWKKEYPNKSREELKSILNKPIIFHTNEHTNGYKHSWYLDKRTCNTKNINIYSLKINTTNCRNLAKILKDPSLKLDFSEYTLKN